VLRGEVLWDYNEALGTSETWGPGAEVALGVSDWAMPAVVALVGVLCWRARERATESLLLGSLAMMAGLIAAHKVGSPQFMAWLAPPVVVALCVGARPGFWRPVGVALLAAAGLTGWLYPWGYIPFLQGSALMVTVWVVRNVIVVVVFAVACVALARLGPPLRRAPAAAASQPDPRTRAVSA
jgi:hypothetical protein